MVARRRYCSAIVALVGSFVLASCGAAVRPELPLTPAEEALVAGIEGDWFGMRTYIDISPNPLPGGDVRYAYAHARITRRTLRTYDYQWVSYLNGEVSGQPQYRLELEEGRLRFDPEQHIVREHSIVSVRYLDRVGAVTLASGVLTVDFFETQRYEYQPPISVARHYTLVATRNRP